MAPASSVGCSLCLFFPSLGLVLPYQSSLVPSAHCWHSFLEGTVCQSGLQLTLAVLWSCLGWKGPYSSSCSTPLGTPSAPSPVFLWDCPGALPVLSEMTTWFALCLLPLHQVTCPCKAMLLPWQLHFFKGLF